MENKTTFSIDLPTCFVTCVFCFVAIIITNMGDGTVYYNLTLIPFTKWFESSENLVNLLESRGLQICDRNKAIQYLDYIGYYRLSALLLLLEKPVVIIQEYGTSKMPFSQQFPLVPQENG